MILGRLIWDTRVGLCTKETIFVSLQCTLQPLQSLQKSLLVVCLVLMFFCHYKLIVEFIGARLRPNWDIIWHFQPKILVKETSE